MKPIHIDNYSEIIRRNCMSMLDSALKAPTLSDKFNLSVNLKELIPPMVGGAIVTFSARAYSKMMYIVQHEDMEVAMHGTIYREPSEDPHTAAFFVDDILVYPQEVTAAFAEATDDYGDWLAHLSDEVFNNLRLQVHSHVLMSVFPSGTDTTFYNKIVADVKDFYVFMIVNKRSEVWCEIYDVENNIYYEKQDVKFMTLFSDDPEDSSNTMNLVLRKNVTAKRSTSYGTYQGYTPPATAPAAAPTQAAKVVSSKEKKKKGQQHQQKKTGTTNGSKHTGTEAKVGGSTNGIHVPNREPAAGTNPIGNRTVSNPHFGNAIDEYQHRIQSERTQRP